MQHKRHLQHAICKMQAMVIANAENGEEGVEVDTYNQAVEKIRQGIVGHTNQAMFRLKLFQQMSQGINSSTHGHTGCYSKPGGANGRDTTRRQLQGTPCCIRHNMPSGGKRFWQRTWHMIRHWHGARPDQWPNRSQAGRINRGRGGEEDEMVGGQKHLITDLHQEPAWTWTWLMWLSGWEGPCHACNLISYYCKGKPSTTSEQGKKKKNKLELSCAKLRKAKATY